MNSAYPCPLCFAAIPQVGTSRAFRRHDRSTTAILFCARCGIYRAAVPGSIYGQSDYAAGYTRPEKEAAWLTQREQFYRRVLRLVSGSLRPRTGSPLLVDFGSCYGHLMRLAEAAGYCTVGVEINPELVALARRRGHRIVTSVDEIPDGIDAVTFIDSIYYIEDPVAVLRRIRAKLNRGGLVLARPTNRNWLATARRLSGGHDLSILGDELVSYSPRSIRSVFFRAGFLVERVSPDDGSGKILQWPKRLFYRCTGLASRLSFNRIILTPGVIVVARKA